MTFKAYLQKENYAQSSRKGYERIKDKFTDWCEHHGHQPETIDYKSCLVYLKYLQQPRQGKTVVKNTIKSEMVALKIFFNFLVETESRTDNPIENLNIRGVKHGIHHNLLGFDELEALYYNYKTEDIGFPHCPSVAMRNKVLTGLMVYQGLNGTVLKGLKQEHLDMGKGGVYIPSTRKTNSRILELKSQQILPLCRYLDRDRKVLQDKINCHTEALFPVKGERFFINNRLFFEL